MQYQSVRFGGIFKGISKEKMISIKMEKPTKWGNPTGLSMKKCFILKGCLPLCDY